MRWVLASLFLISLPCAAGPAGDLAKAIREASFDQEECYRVRDLTIVREDIRLFLTDGRLIFSKPVAGRRIAAVFTADTDGGEAEVMLLPPNRAERRSLALFTGTPNLNERFQSAVLLFTSDVFEQVKEQIAGNPANRKAPEIAALLDEQWTPVLRNLGGSYQTRLALDLLEPQRRGGLFAALLANTRLGNIDIVFDPSSADQIVAGRVSTLGGRLFFDTWTSFPGRSSRARPAPRIADITVRDYRIEATVGADYSLSVVTRVKVAPAADNLRAIPFDITSQMTVSEVLVDGVAAEVLSRDALRVNIMRGGNALTVVVPSEPLRAGHEYEFEFHHSGNVILDAGQGVFFVNARGNWYPMNSPQFAVYDLLFRYPRDLDLVAAGDVVEDRVEGEQRITRRRTPAPIRVAAFNLGYYDHAKVSRGAYEVDVVANRTLETALRPRPVQVEVIPRPNVQRRTEAPIQTVPPPAPIPPNPTARLQELASEVASALEFMASNFGPPALPRLTVSPIPGTFGQGFPGLIYISTLSYLRDRPIARDGTHQELFFDDILQAHETAHQWFGNRILPAAYRDGWLMEALANYSALMYLEKRRGPREVAVMLDSYLDALLATNESGQTVESMGPIVLNGRLESSIEPRAARNIIYGKGSWIMHMLRAQLGDARFLAMIGELLRTYDRKEVTTEQFRELAARYLPAGSDDPKLEGFFEQWVYGTGIPQLKLTYSVRGKAPNLRLTGTVTQSGVADDFSALVPIEIQAAKNRTITQWVRAGKDPTEFTVSIRQKPLRVTLDPNRAVLRTK